MRLIKIKYTVADTVKLTAIICEVIKSYQNGESMESIADRLNIYECEVFEILEDNNMA